MTIVNPSRSPTFSRVGTSVSSRRSSADAIRSRLLFKLGIYDPNFTNASIDYKIRCESFATSSSASSGASTRSKDTADTSAAMEVIPQQQPRRISVRTSTSSLSSQEEDEPQDDGNGHESSAPYFIPLKFDEDPQVGNGPHLISSNTSSSSVSNDGFNSEPPMSIGKSSRARAFIQFDPTVTVIPVPSHRSLSPRMHAQLYTPKEEMSSNAVRNTQEFIYEGWDANNVVEENGMYICKTSGVFVHPAHVGLQKVVNPYL